MSESRRLEDLGRLAEKLQVIFDDDFWQLIPGRKKDFCEYVEALSVDARDELMHKLAYGMESMREKVADCVCLADGNDDE